jgi:K+/H+ antiporter YhaU regulatory subunit KhtT
VNPALPKPERKGGVNKALYESDLRKQDILVLAIERNGETIPNPSPDTKILLGDKLVCFGIV